jgi:tRNA (guanine26-N2/guanine27-N2)-dimethyltransferase
MVGAGPPHEKEMEVALGREGGTDLYLPPPKTATKGPASRAAIFFNPTMAFSRDLSVSVIDEEFRLKGRRLSIWDSMAATGVRGMRMLKETRAVERVLATDLNPMALKVIEANANLEGSGRLEARRHSAREPPSDGPFDMVDVDPYGTPAPFIESALSATRDGGILAVTATDMPVLSGPERTTCEKRYGGASLRGYLSREAGLRILISHVSREAAAKERKVSPMMSFIGGYYVRTFLRVAGKRDGTEPNRDERSRIGVVPFEGYSGPALPRGAKAGPLWLGPLHDPSFVAGLLPVRSAGAAKATEQYLGILAKEVTVDVLFYYETGPLAKHLRLLQPPPREDILNMLRDSGWVSERTHASPGGWRTHAPFDEVARLIGHSGNVRTEDSRSGKKGDSLLPPKPS